MTTGRASKGGVTVATAAAVYLMMRRCSPPQHRKKCRYASCVIV